MSRENKNRPKKLVRDIINTAKSYAAEDYPKEKGYKVSVHGDEVWVDRVDKNGQETEVLTIEINRQL